ncbi:MAG: helix-turn-helix domain-containing protein [Polyangiales bacterium]
MLLLVQAEAVASLQQAADRLLRHRNTVSRWAADYRRGGLDALLQIKPAGKPPGQRTIPDEAFDALKARLDSETGFASYVEVEHWLRDEHGVTVCYSTLHQIVRYELGAKLKAPRPSHPKKAA